MCKFTYSIWKKGLFDSKNVEVSFLFVPNGFFLLILCLETISNHTKAMKRYLFFLSVFMLSMTIGAQTPVMQEHEVLPGETLYSIARRYNMSVQSIVDCNPGLVAEHIMAGRKLQIPVGQAAPVQNAKSVVPVQTVQTVSPVQPKFKTLHEVKKKETVYSISRQYGISEFALLDANPPLQTGKLKKGMVLNIPFTAEEVARTREVQRKAQEEAEAAARKYTAINVAVILPFAKSEVNMTAESQKMANLYQGFLLAVDSLKQRGCSVNIYAYDECGNVRNILQQPAMEDMQLIVGPMRQYNLAAVANFAQERGIAHVVPLSNEQSIVNNRPTTFQVNVPSSLIHSQVYNRFAVMHKGENIIFVSMNDRGDNAAYVSGFRSALNGFSMKYSSTSIDDFDSLKDLLKTDVRNVLVLSSGSATAFDHVCKKLNALNVTEEYKIQLFGTPEWLALTGRHEADMNKYNCQFFTSFYSNGTTERIRQFNQHFQQWFRQGQYHSIPHYGELGYDIGAYFIKGLNDYGKAFYENLHSYAYNSMEFPFNFERKDQQSGYQNRTVLFVTRRPDGQIVVR